MEFYVNEEQKNQFKRIKEIKIQYIKKVLDFNQKSTFILVIQENGSLIQHLQFFYQHLEDLLNHQNYLEFYFDIFQLKFLINQMLILIDLIVICWKPLIKMT